MRMIVKQLEYMYIQRSFSFVRRSLSITTTTTTQFISTTKTTNSNYSYYSSKSKETDMSQQAFSRAGLEDLMKRRFFITPAFEIYGGVAGLYDYGPPGCAIKANLINLWRQHFVINEDMLEVDCTSLTPEVVLKTSGHVAKFADFMVKDEITKQCYRADHLLEQHIDKLLEDKKITAERKEELTHVRAKAGDYGQSQLTEALKKYGVKCPDTGNAITEPYPFNLMFQTQIGPSGQLVGFMRPETAQGIFVNFKRLLDYNANKLPFAAAQIGNSFRNEIAPRSGLLRVREFTMAEIEHFVNPHDKSHPKFEEVANIKANLLTSEAQDGDKKVVEMTFGDAVKQGTINNQTLAYFMCRTQLFLHTIGIKPERMRFRQHQQNEMAHYASDCWDAEIHTSYGWIECVGHADRSCYDLTVHSDASRIPLVAFEEFKDGPKTIEVVDVKINKSKMGSTFKKDAKAPMDYLEGLATKMEEALKLRDELDAAGSATIVVNDQGYNITKEMVSFTQATKKLTGQSFAPHVIEPSFGLGRIIYSLLEHSYSVRPATEEDKAEDANKKLDRAVLSLPAIIAPVKTSVLPLTQSEALAPFVQQITRLLKEQGISSKVDESGVAIGRRYARTDEIGIPFAITIDFTTVEDQTVTLRERDTMIQVRVPLQQVATTIKQLSENTLQWTQVANTFPAHKF
ncbi:glycyl-tRNA synthetase [Cavenderia fasciculata]|uniref:glycine--tRNA ligase n=1 Tax=Cavenderia fasciculata TaxID=261658 RepID=F4Q1Z0_CACFS|nr:glycyl-tRNA synthetase [Cavenderia fasciculata]EGG18010.1 glycyl-tRNA synthetase [Cavenderia fasciculata]|eukprot:XP_004356903.1 glycyl-tRNA synthetase [Cavenderia fasciculata]